MSPFRSHFRRTPRGMRSNSGRRAVATAALGLSLALGLGACSFDLGSITRVDPLQSKVVLGDSGPKLAMLEIDGIISAQPSRSPLGVNAPSMLATAREALDLAAEDSEVAALIVRVRSPGGTVAASEALHHEIARWKQETGRPVTAYLQGIAASGGYYAAMASDRIVAQPSSVTGSIGVIMPGFNIAGLMKRYGVSDQTFTSGEFKDSGSMLRPMRKGERRQLQGVIDALYARFVEVVRHGRPELSPEAVSELADGRIFTSTQALEVGLVDELGYLEDVQAALEKQIGATESRVIVYRRGDGLRQNIYAGSPPPPAKDGFGLLPSRRLPAGFYYLWPPALDD